MDACAPVVVGPEVAPSLADRYRQAVVERADSRRDELVEVVESAILADQPDYSTGRSAADLADIRGGVQRSIGLCLAAIAQGRGPSAAELAAMRVTGGQRARQGIPRSAVLASVKIGTRVGRAFLMTLGEPTDDPDALLAAFRQITDVLDRFEDEATRAMAEGYDEAYINVLSSGDRSEAVLVDRLLERRFHDDAEVLRHAAEVGLLPSREAYLVVLTSLSPTDGCLHDATVRLRARARIAVGPLRSTHGAHLPVLLQPGANRWEELLPLLERLARETSTVVVWHDEPAALVSMSSAYWDLQRGLPYLPAVTKCPGVLPAVLIRFHRAMFGGTAEDRLQLVHDVLAPVTELPAREGAELLETLDCYYETGGSTAMLARHLHVHKNTVGNRLRRVKELTGLDVRQPRERLVLESVMRMRWVTEPMRVGR